MPGCESEEMKILINNNSFEPTTVVSVTHICAPAPRWPHRNINWNIYERARGIIIILDQTGTGGSLCVLSLSIYNREYVFNDLSF